MTECNLDSAGGLGCLDNDFRRPCVVEDSPSDQGSADRVDHEGSMIHKRFVRTFAWLLLAGCRLRPVYLICVP